MKLSATNIYTHTALRGLAAMYVVGFHLVGTWHSSGEVFQLLRRLFRFGGYSVDLFFILSGFVLNWVYLSKAGSISWRSYFVARVARILPLYYLTLFAFLPVICFSLWRHGYEYVGANIYSKLAQNLFVVSGILAGAEGTINFPAWSISVEFFCYLLVFPILVWLERRLLWSARASLVFGAITLLLTLFLASFYHSEPLALGELQWNYDPLKRGVFGFAIGFSLCAFFRRVVALRPTAVVTDVVFLISGLVFGLGISGIVPETCMVIFFPGLVFCSATDRGVFAAASRLRLFQWLGDRSYGIYLWHGVCMSSYTQFLTSSASELVSSGILIAIILFVSDLSYRWFECPARSFIRNRGMQSFKLAGVK